MPCLQLWRSSTKLHPPAMRRHARCGESSSWSCHACAQPAQLSLPMRDELEHLQVRAQPRAQPLGPARAESLVFVHSNLRLLRKLRAVDYYERFPAHPFESESDSDAEEVAGDGWASEDSDEGELSSDEGSKEGNKEEGKEDSEDDSKD